MKRGFTLVEMMAVIVIIGILSIVTVSLIVNKIKGKSSDIDDVTKKIIYNAANLYLTDTVSEIGENSTFCVPLNDLVNKGYLSDPISNTEDISLSNVVEIKNQNGINSYKIVSANNCVASNVTYVTISKLKNNSNSNCNFSNKQNCKDNKLNKIDSYNNPSSSSYPFALSHAYIGSSPSNLLILGSNCFSIIGVTNNNSLKIIYEGVSNNNKCSELANNNTNLLSKQWYNEDQKISFSNSNISSDLNNLINDSNLDLVTTFGSLSLTSTDKQKLKKAIFYVGDFKGNTLQNLINSERTSTYESYVGLLNSSDFIFASSSSNCSITQTSTQNCNQNNYLTQQNNIWSINTSSDKITSINNGVITSTSSNSALIVRPVLFLKDNIRLTGKGTVDSPYIVQ